ncbi:MAG: class I SAM-dependent methyltransferase [Chloroflexota bacterium]
MYEVRLKPGRERALLRRHPWVFSGAVASLQGDPPDGETVRLVAADGSFLAWGAYSSHSQIRVRAWSWNPDERIDADFLRTRLERALAARKALVLPQETNALRLVHAESDGLPGLIVDRYADTLVVQLLSSGPERWREQIVAALVELSQPACIYERSDAGVRELEGLPLRTGLLYGEMPADALQIHENGLKFWVDVRQGHKTGYYLDQRQNRLHVGQLAGGRQVLDCFSYTGGFAAFALAHGAAGLTAIDASEEALDMARRNLALNDLPAGPVEWLPADVFQALRAFRDQGRSFDLVILDPPKFAATAAQATRAARGYKDINLLAFKLLRPGGLLATFSCSGGVDPDLFQKIVAGAALDAGVQAQIVGRLQQSSDHPVALNFPEGAYLKGLVLRLL